MYQNSNVYQLPMKLEQMAKKDLGEVTLKDLLVLTQGELFSFLTSNLPKEYTKRVGKTIMVVPPKWEGVKFRPLLMAHLDTVAHFPPYKYEIREKGDTLMLSKWAKTACLGGDDRAGVYIMLQLIASEHFERYTYCFFKDEETGCIGSTQFSGTEEFKDLETETSCFIGIDRKCSPGRPEIAQYGCDSDDLDKVLIEQLPEFNFSYGSFTDCSTLSEDSILQIPCFNITAGYQNEHTKKETIHIPSMMGSLEALMRLDVPDKQFKYEEKVHFYYGRSGVNYGDWRGYEDGDEWDIQTQSWESPTTGVMADAIPIRCDLCHEHAALFEDPTQSLYICEECYRTERY